MHGGVSELPSANGHHDTPVLQGLLDTILRMSVLRESRQLPEIVIFCQPANRNRLHRVEIKQLARAKAGHYRAERARVPTIASQVRIIQQVVEKVAFVGDAENKDPAKRCSLGFSPYNGLGEPCSADATWPF